MPPKYFFINRVIHLAITIGATLVIAVFSLLKFQEVSVTTTTDTDILKLILPLIALTSMGSSLFVPKLILAQNLKKAQNLPDKLNAYRVSMLIKWALLQGAVFILAVAIFLIGSTLYVALGISILILLALQKPLSKTDLEPQLTLSDDEKFIYKQLES